MYCMPATRSSVALVIALGAAWLYATLALCVATFTATTAIVNLLLILASFFVLLYSPGLPRYAAIEEADGCGPLRQLLAHAPPPLLLEIWAVAVCVSYVCSTVAVSADGRFYFAFMLLALAAVVVIGVPALGGQRVIVAVFTSTAWWFAFCFYELQQYGCTFLAVVAGPPLGLLMCAIARLIVTTMDAVRRRCGRRASWVVPPLLLFLAFAPVFKWLRPASPAKKEARCRLSAHALVGRL